MTCGIPIERRVRVVISRVLCCPLSRLHDGADFRRDLGADSLDLVAVPAALEEEFSVHLTDDEVEFTQTIGTAIDVIRAKLENGSTFDRRAGAR